MHQFSDTAGRCWQISLTIGAVKRVRDTLRINLLDPLGSGRRNGKPERRKRLPLLTRLQLDPALLIDVIFVLVKPQAEQAGVTDQQFGEALGGEAAYGAYEAFIAEWQSFFHGLRRESEAKAIKANAELVKAEDQRNMDLVDQATRTAEALTEKRRRRAIAKLESIVHSRSPIVITSPESSVSIPAD